MNTAAYILNRSPTRKLENITPEEAWTGVKPSVSHLRVFGSICYRHVPDQLRTKLDDKGEMMILIGYHSTGGYKLLNPMNKIMISRDVVVDESKDWEWNVTPEIEKQNQVELQLEDSDTVTVQENETGEGSAEGPRRSLRQRQVP